MANFQSITLEEDGRTVTIVFDQAMVQVGILSPGITLNYGSSNSVLTSWRWSNGTSGVTQSPVTINGNQVVTADYNGLANFEAALGGTVPPDTGLPVINNSQQPKARLSPYWKLTLTEHK